MIITILLMPLLAGLISAEPQRGGGFLGMGNNGNRGGNRGGGAGLGGALGLNLGGLGVGFGNNDNRPGPEPFRGGGRPGGGRPDNRPGQDRPDNRPEPAGSDAAFRCNADNCLRALERYKARLGNTCAKFEAPNARGAPNFIPNECNSSRISSACRCITISEGEVPKNKQQPRPTGAAPPNNNNNPPPAQPTARPPPQQQQPPPQTAQPRPTQAPPAQQSPRPVPSSSQAPAPAPAPTQAPAPPPSGGDNGGGSGGSTFAYQENNSLQLSGNQIYTAAPGIPSKREALPQVDRDDDDDNKELVFEEENQLQLNGDKIYVLPPGIPSRQ